MVLRCNGNRKGENPVTETVETSSTKKKRWNKKKVEEGEWKTQKNEASCSTSRTGGHADGPGEDHDQGKEMRPKPERKKRDRTGWYKSQPEPSLPPAPGQGLTPGPKQEGKEKGDQGRRVAHKLPGGGNI